VTAHRLRWGWGCRAVGVAGGTEKVRQCLDEFGCDAAIDYKATGDLEAALVRHCPDGIDAFFDNTWRAIHDAVLRHINLHARIAICGTASFPSWEPWNQGLRPERHLLVKHATTQGFLTTDYAARFDEAVTASCRVGTRGTAQLPRRHTAGYRERTRYHRKVVFE
jgi:NADPH-dependent curcumin reductase CurA